MEPFDPWPGIALAVRREDRRWPAGHPAVRARARRSRSIARCAPRAWTRRSPRASSDRGRLTVGQRADIAIIPAAAIDEPVEPGGALATARPSIVLLDGRVVFER